MGWYALEEIQNALDDTKELLFPFNWKTWAKIAFITVFLGGSGLSNIPTPSGQTYQDAGQTGTSYSAPMESFSQGQFSLDSITGMATGSGETLVLLGVLAIVIPLVLVLMLVSSVFKFVFYQSLMDKEVSIRKNVDRHFGKGLRFLGAQLLITGVAVLVIAGMIFIGALSPLVGVLAILAGIPIFILMAFILKLFNEFVPLKMMDDESGVVEATRSFYEDVVEEWKQVLVYLLVSIGIGIGTGIAALMAMVMLGLVLLIPFGILAFLGSLVAEWLLAVAIGIGVAVWLFAILYFVSGPITTFIHYYVIRVYHRLTA